MIQHSIDLEIHDRLTIYAHLAKISNKIADIGSKESDNTEQNSNLCLWQILLTNKLRITIQMRLFIFTNCHFHFKNLYIEQIHDAINVYNLHI